MKELKRVFRSYCKMPNFLCFTDTLSATLPCSFLLSKDNYILLIKNSILTSTEQHRLTKALLK